MGFGEVSPDIWHKHMGPGELVIRGEPGAVFPELRQVQQAFLFNLIPCI
jgi:hypothetical protein